MLACKDQLGVGEGYGWALGGRDVLEARMVFVDARQRGGGQGGCVAKKFFRLLLVLGEIWAVGKGAIGHTKLLSRCAWNVRMNQAERRFARLR